jgi:Domain of unknown function (DUF5753)
VIPTPPGVLERLVRVRIIRQELLSREPPLRLTVVIDESRDRQTRRVSWPMS